MCGIILFVFEIRTIHGSFIFTKNFKRFLFQIGFKNGGFMLELIVKFSL